MISKKKKKMSFKINVSNNQILSWSEGDLSSSKSHSKFRCCKCFTLCCQSIKENNSEMVERGQFVYASQTGIEKLPEKIVSLSLLWISNGTSIWRIRSLRKHNQGFRYLLTCIDILCKYVWAIPLKTK